MHLYKSLGNENGTVKYILSCLHCKMHRDVCIMATAQKSSVFDSLLTCTLKNKVSLLTSMIDDDVL